MPDNSLLANIKKLRELTGVGFKDCKLAIDENNGDIDKSIEFLRKKGIAKASKKMSRTASEGLVLVNEIEGKVSIIEINSETDFVAKNNDFISFCKEISEINLKESGNLENINKSIMHNNVDVKNNLIDLIAKMGEKITLRRSKFFDKSEGKNYFYVHGSVEKNIGKIISIVKLKNINDKNKDLGTKLAMHITAASPLSIDKNDLDKSLIDKELEIIKAEIVNSGKKPEIAEKIAKGKLNKFISDSTLMNQDWIMDPKIKVSDILKDLKVLDFVRYKVGEGV
jgi:elongation factor Ts